LGRGLEMASKAVRLAARRIDTSEA
jgi:hypothetical protein